MVEGCCDEKEELRISLITKGAHLSASVISGGLKYLIDTWRLEVKVNSTDEKTLQRFFFSAILFNSQLEYKVTTKR